jgi:K+-sensing histidine kinase KdpD
MIMENTFDKILLAIDKTAASTNALVQACNYASLFKSELTVLFVSRDTFETFDDAKKQIKDFTFPKGIGVELAERKGKFYDEVAKFEKQGDFTLIILGTQDKKGFKPFWNSNDIFNVINSSKCPVLTVKASSDEFKLDHILLPLTDSTKTRQKVPYCAEIAKRSGATIHLLGISSTSGSETEKKVNSYLRQTENFLSERGLKYTVETRFGTRVSNGIMTYATHVNAGLILIMTETESEGLFMDSYSQKLVYSSEIPVMSIHSRDTRLTGQAGY